MFCTRRGRILERRPNGRRHWGVGQDGHIRNPALGDSMRRNWSRPKLVNNMVNPVADVKVKLSGGDQVLKKSTLIRDHPERGEVQEDLLGESEVFPPTTRPDSQQDEGEARNDFWSIAGNYICRHRIKTRIKHCVPRKETFSIPLKYIDVSRATSATLDVLLERRIDVYLECGWGPRIVRCLYTTYSVHRIKWKTCWRIYMVQGEGGLTKRQGTSRPYHLWPEIWENMSDASQRREKQKWAIEKPRLDNARRLRGIYIIDPKDEEFVNPWKTPGRKLEIPMEAAMPCKISNSQHRVTYSSTGNCKTKFACNVEARESTGKRLEGSLPAWSRIPHCRNRN